MSAEPHEKCAERLRAIARYIGTEVTVSTAPPTAPSPYGVNPFTCPHKVTFYVEPTPEQVAKWVAEGVE